MNQNVTNIPGDVAGDSTTTGQINIGETISSVLTTGDGDIFIDENTSVELTGVENISDLSADDFVL